MTTQTHIARRANVGSAIGWMIGLSVALFWIPVVGGLVAGFVGGRRAGGIGPAIAAVFIPGVFLFLLSLFLGGLFGWIPVIGTLVHSILGMGGYVLSFVNVIPLLIGAIVGGATADR